MSRTAEYLVLSACGRSSTPLNALTQILSAHETSSNPYGVRDSITLLETLCITLVKLQKIGSSDGVISTYLPCLNVPR